MKVHLVKGKTIGVGRDYAKYYVPVGGSVRVRLDYADAAVACCAGRDTAQKLRLHTTAYNFVLGWNEQRTGNFFFLLNTIAFNPDNTNMRVQCLYYVCRVYSVKLMEPES